MHRWESQRSRGGATEVQLANDGDTLVGLDGAAVDRVIECAKIIEYAENVDSVPDKVWDQTVIPFWQAYRAMTEGEYAYLFRDLGERDDETANNVV